MKELIITGAPAKLVLVVDLATETQQERSRLLRDLEAKSYQLHWLRGKGNQRACGIAAADADHYLAERAANGFIDQVYRSSPNGAGHAYAVAPYPEFAPARIKLGWSSDIKGRLDSYRTIAPGLRLLRLRRTFAVVVIAAILALGLMVLSVRPSSAAPQLDNPWVLLGLDVNQGAVSARDTARDTTPSEANFLGLAEYYESGGRNVRNYRYDPQHTAQGHWQITNTNWRRLAPQLGITTPTAMDASRDDQARVALALLRERPDGQRNWTDFNPALAHAVSSGMQIRAPQNTQVAVAGSGDASGDLSDPVLDQSGKLYSSGTQTPDSSNTNTQAMTTQGQQTTPPADWLSLLIGQPAADVLGAAPRSTVGTSGSGILGGITNRSCSGE
jgi:hypothetical protein